MNYRYAEQDDEDRENALRALGHHIAGDTKVEEAKSVEIARKGKELEKRQEKVTRCMYRVVIR